MKLGRIFRVPIESSDGIGTNLFKNGGLCVRALR